MKAFLEAISPYAAQQLERLPNKAPQLATDANEDDLLRYLRRRKHYFQVQFLRELSAQEITQETFLHKISKLAEELIESALSWQYCALCQRYGDPQMNLTVLGMGKLGGGELNFSSDIDLIFAYEKSGEIEKNGKITDFAVFFQKLAQKLIYSLDAITEDGGVYRVDMRLRPFGQSGPLVLTYEAAEQYYTIHGRNWERYALMKARPVAGDIAGGKRLLNILRPFIYRRYHDYRAFQAIGQMKNLINQQINENSMARNIKLGAGGIREAEFVVQAMQMVYGGQYPRLQQTHYLTALKDLDELNFWEHNRAERLKNAYLLLRTIENALQFEHEQQVHTLPEDDKDWERLAVACHFVSVVELKTQLDEARQFVRQCFNDIFPVETQNTSEMAINWHAPAADLRSQGADEDIISVVNAFCEKLPWQRLPENSNKHLQKILPHVLRPNAKPILNLLEQVSSRSAYLYLLAEQPQLITQLFAIAEKSDWLINFIIEHPLVLDDILTARQLPDLTSLRDDLNARTQALSDEEFPYALRDFKNAELFKVALYDIQGRLPLMKVSDRLSDIAELILLQALQRAYQTLTKKYGKPLHSDGCEAKFSIIAYGKLGGLELGYGSDLDLVFLFDDGDGGTTDGTKSLENSVFFTRLTQRIINILNTASTSGFLYQIDTRLRPNGQSGLLISSLRTFARYQLENAQTWEHQALARARFITGDKELGERFRALRAEILALPRNVQELRANVLEMRAKMHEFAQKSPADKFHLKKDEGGLIDIEFIVQYLLLKNAVNEPILTRMSDNVRQLAGLEVTGILTSSQAMTLRDTYRKLRAEAHHRYLSQSGNLVDRDKWLLHIESVKEIWKVVFSE